MNNKIDKRIIKTKEKIRSTCFILLKKYDWQQLSIAYIAKEAGVNRSTFYANFEDKQTLLEQTLSYVYLNTLEKKWRSFTKEDVAFYQELIDDIVKLHQSIKEEFTLSYNQINSSLSHLLIQIIETAIKSRSKNGNITTSFISWGIYGVAIQLLQTPAHYEDSAVINGLLERLLLINKNSNV